MRLSYDDYKKVQKNWNTKAIKTDSTVQFIYKGFILHRCRDSQWGFTYYDIWNDHNPIFSTSRISGPKLYGDDMKDCLLYTSPSPRDRTRSRMPSSA